MINQQEVPEAASTTAAKEIALRILTSLTPGQELRRVNVRLWDGSHWPDSHPKDATVVLNRPSALKEMLLAGTEAAVGEAYIRGAFDIEGDMEAAFELGDLIIEHTDGWAKKLKLGYLLHRLPDPNSTDGHSPTRSAHLVGQQHSLKRDRDAIRFHYDVSNDFYRLWLDPWMAYSCAYFTHRDESLDTAQVNKFDHICRKLDLKPGDRLLDIGCGWGGLLIHAATHFGVEGEGITISQKQSELAQKRIYDAGLQDRVFVRIQDYRELKERECYDAIVSVGMVEHVGKSKLAAYFDQASRLLKPGGLFLNHGIGTGPIPLPDQSGSFIQQYVFPDSNLLPICQTLEYAEACQLEVRDVESLREHYALTLRHWIQRLERHHQDALQFVDETAYRIWTLYMAGCAHGFRIGQLSVYQTLLAKLRTDGGSRAALTRNSWYRNRPTSALVYPS
jgi:cyclopropane-fatty-acyl-phospholipid synthase